MSDEDIRWQVSPDALSQPFTHEVWQQIFDKVDRSVRNQVWRRIYTPTLILLRGQVWRETSRSAWMGPGDAPKS